MEPNDEEVREMEVDVELKDEGLPVRKGHMDLRGIAEDIDDINDPSSMDKILMYMEEIKDEDYFFMEVIKLVIFNNL